MKRLMMGIVWAITATAAIAASPASVTTDEPIIYTADIANLYGTITNTDTGRVFDAYFFWAPGDGDGGTNTTGWANTNLVTTGVVSGEYTRAYINVFDTDAGEYTYRAAISNSVEGWTWGSAVTFGTAVPVVPAETFESSIPAVSYAIESSSAVIRVEGIPGTAYTLPFSVSFVASNVVVTVKLEEVAQ